MNFIQEDVVKEFIERLPPITYSIPTVHLIMLATRSRFAKLILKIKIKDLVVDRKVIRPKKNWQENYFQKVYNFAVLSQYGLYTYRKDTDNYRITSPCFGIYGTIIPRSVKSAISNILNESIQVIISDNEEQRNNKLPRHDINFFAKLHKHKHSKSAKMVTLDIDNPDIFQDVRDCVTCFDIWMITRTSRGYHIVMDLQNRETAKEFYIAGGVWDTMVNTYRNEVELQRDPQEPIPGTLYIRPDSVDKPNFVEIVQ